MKLPRFAVYSHCMRRLVICILLTISVIGYSQNTLFRGRVATRYSFIYNGTPCWDTSGYSESELLFDGFVYKGVLLDIDACRQEVLVRQTPASLPIAPERDLIGYFIKDGHVYVNLRYAGFKEAPEGFFQEMTDGRKVYYYQVVKALYSEVGDHNGPGGIGYDDPGYREGVTTYFYLTQHWYEYRAGTLVKLSKRKGRRLHLSHADEVPSLPDSYLVSRRLRPSESDLRVSEAMRAARPSGDLPTGYFSAGESTSDRSALYDAIQQDNIIAMYRNKIYEVGNVRSARGGSAIVSGTVRDVASGELLPGVAVTEPGGAYAFTDAQGRYSIKVPLGERRLTFSEYTKEDMPIRVIVRSDGTLDIVMKEKVTALRSAYVSAEGMADHRRTGMGLEKMNMRTLSKIPSAFGEGDVLKAVTNLPGVKTVGEASSGFNVRGGSADQNLILFNEGTIYNPSHMFGIFSAFNPDVVDNVELYKSSIPVQCGGRISSVLDIQSKEGDQEKIKGSLGLGLLTSHFSVEGPVGGSRTTFVLGGRTTYSNWLLGLLPDNSGYAGGSADFNDLNLGVTHRIDDSNTLQAFAYWSRDKFEFSGDTTFRYNNLNAALRWRHKYGADNLMTVSAGYDRYANQLTDNNVALSSYSLSTSVGQAFLRTAFSSVKGDHTLSYGGSAVMYMLNPGVLTPFADESEVSARSLSGESALEPALYFGDQWKASPVLSVDGGARLSGFASFGRGGAYLGPELRLSAKYSPQPNLSLKAGVNTMTQYIHLISNTSSISPMDTWKVCDADIKPQRGLQAASGLYWTVFGGQVDISLEGYFKWVDNFLDYKSGAVLTMNDHLADDLVTTYNRSYGLELMLRKQTGRLTGWLAYTLSRSELREMQDRGVLTINRGEWYAAPHDKPHDVKLVTNYKFTHRYSLSVNVDYSTGRPVTIPIGQYYYNGGIRLSYSDRNGYRIPDYFRMDMAFNIDPGHYLKAFTHMTATIGCYNVTGRRNAYSVYYSTGGGTKVKGYMLSVFATQIPYLSLNLKF